MIMMMTATSQTNTAADATQDDLLREREIMVHRNIVCSNFIIIIIVKPNYQLVVVNYLNILFEDSLNYYHYYYKY